MKCAGQKVTFNRRFGIQKTGCEAFARHTGVEGAARTSTIPSVHTLVQLQLLHQHSNGNVVEDARLLLVCMF